MDSSPTRTGLSMTEHRILSRPARSPIGATFSWRRESACHDRPKALASGISPVARAIAPAWSDRRHFLWRRESVHLLCALVARPLGAQKQRMGAEQRTTPLAPGCASTRASTEKTRNASAEKRRMQRQRTGRARKNRSTPMTEHRILVPRPAPESLSFGDKQAAIDEQLG
jgi:hypothetical protein